MEELKLNTIDEAIADFREGKFVIVVDDEDRENEGDLIVAAEKITPEQVNFMLKHARGVLCAPITISRCKELELPHQVDTNTSVLGTPFTVTVDKLEGCSTGVSIHDRAATIRALADPTSTPETFGRPGHVNPLYAQDKGVLRRAGHTEACIDMARLAGLYPAAALMEIMSEDGTMARLPELRKMADEWGLKLISIRDLIAYRLKQDSLVEKGVEVDMPTEYGHFRLIPFRQKSNGLEHIAIIKGDIKEGYGHVHLVSFVYFINAFRAEISFGNHLHFHFCGTDGVTTSYHGSEIVIAAEPGIGGNQKVSQIYRVADVSVPAWGDCL